MNAPAANRESKDILRALMDPSRHDMVPWSSSELRAMLEHQLATPLASEHERFAEIAYCSLEQVSAVIEGCRGDTFGDLLRYESSSIKAVRLVKDFAKESLANEGDLPKEVARVLYIMAILRGRDVGGGHMTSLDDESVEREARRCLTFGWLPEDVRNLIRAQLRRDDAK